MLQHLTCAEVCLGETIITKIKAIRFFTGFQLCAHNPTVKWVPGGRIPIRTTEYKSWCLAILTDNRHHNTNTHVHGIYTFIYIYVYMYIYIFTHLLNRILYHCWLMPTCFGFYRNSADTDAFCLARYFSKAIHKRNRWMTGTYCDSNSCSSLRPF